MLNNLLKTTYLYFNKIKVVHSIPGRLRVSVPGMNKIPSELQKYEDSIITLIKLLDGIESVEFSYITSKILFKYDKTKLDEKKVLKWINIIFKQIISKESLIKDKSLYQVEKEFNSLYSLVKDELILIRKDLK